jgi:pyruvate/2-oxoglutarate dehydrogenase complex dihydrolipoamide acyltransferase (E2) component
MNDRVGPFQVVDLTPGRRAWLNTLDLSGPTHWMIGLLEVDVTVARKRIIEYEGQKGEKLSFTGFLVCCLARAVQENKEVQSYLRGRRQLVLFENVNVGVMIEHDAEGKRSLMGHIVRAANQKSYLEIHREIRHAQSAPVPQSRGMAGWFRKLMLLPWPLSRLVKVGMGIATRRDPTLRVATSGTVVVTSVGMFGKGHSGWGLATMPVSLSLVVGSMAWKPAVIEGRVEPREILNLTVMFDHEVVDGAPAARFVRRLLELLESGFGLDEIGEQ